MTKQARTTLEAGGATAAHSRDLNWLWERHRTRWEAALAPARPDPDLLRLCADEAHGFAEVLDSADWGIIHDGAWEALTFAGQLLAGYGGMVSIASCCRAAQFPTTLDRAFPVLADACREALRVADRFIIELLPVQGPYGPAGPREGEA